MKITFGIRAKLLLIVSLGLLVVFAGVTSLQVENRTQQLRNELFNETQTFATLATTPIGSSYSLYSGTGSIRVDELVSGFVELNSNVVGVSIFSVAGEEVYRYKQTSSGITVDQARSFEPVYIKHPATNTVETVVYPYFEASGAHRYSVVYEISDDAIEQAVQSEAISLIYFGLVTLIMTIGLLYILLSRLLLKPVQELSRQAQVISAGNLDSQIEIHGSDEIASLGVAVNHMANSLKDSIAKLQEVDSVKSEFMIIASHNLRTPLAIMTGYLETVQSEDDLQAIRQALQKIGASVKRLNVFAEDVLTISRFELGDGNLVGEDVLAPEFMQQVADEFAPSAELKNQVFKTTIDPSKKFIRVSKPHLRSAIWNILDNAAKFSDTGGLIEFTCSYENSWLRIEVKDSGVGISNKEQQKLFTKFHRGTSALEYNFQGTGIGLYAAKLIVERFGGKIEVKSQEGQGSAFTIWLPVFDNHRK